MNSSIIQNREQVEWTNTWIDETQDLTGKRILLVGDSVSRHLRRPLSQVYGCPVDLIGCSAGLNDPIFTNLIEYFFEDNDYRYSLIIIQLNHHGAETDFGAYRERLEGLCHELKTRCDNIVLETLFDIYLERPEKNEILKGITNFLLRAKILKEHLDETRTDICRQRNEEIRNVGNQLGIKVLDVQEMISDRHFIRIDHVHLEKKAYPYVAGKISKEIHL